MNEWERSHILLAESGLNNGVVKIRPPLVLDRADADRLLDGLEAALR